MQIVNEIYIGSLTGKTENEQKEILEKFREDNRKDKIKISIEPNLVNKGLIKMLKQYGISTIELEIQSTNGYILKKCGYTYTIADIKKASKMIKWNRIKLSYQVGVGLPDSTKLDEINTAKELAKLKPNLVRIYPMVVVRNTELEKEFKQGEYEPLTLNQAVERCKEVIYTFNSKKIREISIVKQNELKESEESEIIAGPYHDEFPSLVTDSIWYDSIVEKIKQFNVKVKKVNIEVNPKDLTYIYGHDNENSQKLQEIYDVEIKAQGNPEIKPRKIKDDSTWSI